MREPENFLAERRGVRRDGVERNGGHQHHRHARHDEPRVPQHARIHFGRRRMMLARREFRGFLEGSPDQEDERDNQAADEERDAPPPCIQLLGSQEIRQGVAEYAGKDDGDLLAARLPGHIKSLVSGRGDFRQIDRHAAELDASRKALAPAAQDHHDGREQSDRLVSRHQSDRQRADRHQAQRHEQPLAPADMVDVGAEKQGPQRPDHETHGECRQGKHQGGKGALRGKVGTPDRRAEITENHEVVHFQEVAAGNAEHGSDFLSALGWRQHLAFPLARYPDPRTPGAARGTSLASVLARSECRAHAGSQESRGV